MSNPLELINTLLVTIVTEDHTVIAGRIGADELELLAAEGASSDRAQDILTGIGEALAHDEMFFDRDEFLDQVFTELPYEPETMFLGDLAAALGRGLGQRDALRRKLYELERHGNVRRFPNDRFSLPED